MVRDGDGIIEEILRYFTSAPNPIQLAVAIYAVGLLPQKKHQLWSLPAGTGKSRIIACAALTYLKTRALGQVHIVIPTKLLKDRDQSTFAPLWELGSVQGRVEYHEDIPDLVDATDLVIFDEADLFLFSKYDQVAQMSEKRHVLAFTASVSATNFGSVEQELVRMLNFEALSYSVVKRENEQEADFDQLLVGPTQPKLDELIERYIQD